MPVISTTRWCHAICLFVLICITEIVFADDTFSVQSRSNQADTYLGYDPRPYILINSIAGRFAFDDELFPNSPEVEQTRAGVEFTIGQRLSPQLGFEFGFNSLGHYELTSELIPTARSTVTPKAFEVNLLSYPYDYLNRNTGSTQRNIGFFIKTGYAECRDNNLEQLRLCDRAYFNLGLGLDIQLHRNVGIRLEAQSYLRDSYSARLGFIFRGEFVDALVQILSIGLSVTVGIHR